MELTEYPKLPGEPVEFTTSLWEPEHCATKVYTFAWKPRGSRRIALFGILPGGLCEFAHRSCITRYRNHFQYCWWPTSQEPEYPLGFLVRDLGPVPPNGAALPEFGVYQAPANDSTTT